MTEIPHVREPVPYKPGTEKAQWPARAAPPREPRHWIWFVWIALIIAGVIAWSTGWSPL